MTEGLRRGREGARDSLRHGKLRPAQTRPPVEGGVGFRPRPASSRWVDDMFVDSPHTTPALDTTKPFLPPLRRCHKPPTKG
ncbi:hypothetical protein E2C01_030535 [Portunus trituberculatus]|uniref:Uncharacterized protein n=1 Tax=Portunus trituberculatus TaxID=210409 RepID=A0A5B7ESA4_PORTR|nr:hypothetical protein [Portunus trituberculatus]